MARSLRRTRNSVPKQEEPEAVPEQEVDWLAAGGDNVDAAIKEQKAKARPSVREFFFVKSELAATTDASTGKPKSTGMASAMVHFAVNYADPEYSIVIPRVSIKDGGRYQSYTSIQGDCAICEATGQHASLRPVYILIDHRRFEAEGKEFKDLIKTWIPAGSMMQLISVAIDDLCESVEIDREDIDITKYPARITKSGEKRKTVWSISFLSKPRECSDEAFEHSLMFFHGKDAVEAEAAGTDEITPENQQAKIRTLLAPNPKYMLSQGGKYIDPASQQSTTAGKDEEPPY